MSTSRALVRRNRRQLLRAAHRHRGRTRRPGRQRDAAVPSSSGSAPTGPPSWSSRATRRCSASNTVGQGGPVGRPLLGRADKLPWYFQQLRRGRDVMLEPLPDDLPARRPPSGRTSTRGGIRAIMTVPLAIAGRIRCALSTGAFSSAPRVVARQTSSSSASSREIVANAHDRQRRDAELQAKLDEIRAAVRSACRPRTCSCARRSRRITSSTKSWGAARRCRRC